jgi:hypothetical protein
MLSHKEAQSQGERPESKSGDFSKFSISLVESFSVFFAKKNFLSTLTTIAETSYFFLSKFDTI